MLRFVVRRLLLMIPVLFGLSVLLFVWVRALPGDPARSLLGDKATPESVARVTEQYGFDQPLLQQYFTYIGALLRGDFGTSPRTGQPVLEHVPRPVSRPPSSWPWRRCSSPSWSASRWATAAAKRAGGVDRLLHRRRLAARRGDPGVRAGLPAEDRLRGRAARAAGGAGRPAGVGAAEPADRRHPHHQLLRAGRAAHPGVGRRLGCGRCT